MRAHELIADLDELEEPIFGALEVASTNHEMHRVSRGNVALDLTSDVGVRRGYCHAHLVGKLSHFPE